MTTHSYAAVQFNVATLSTSISANDFEAHMRAESHMHCERRN